jgi:hypothetical protein
MVDADNVLFDDGAVIEYLSNVVSCCADQLNAAFEGLMIRLRAYERGQAMNAGRKEWWILIRFSEPRAEMKLLESTCI